jgi:hypothetical protein
MKIQYETTHADLDAWGDYYVKLPQVARIFRLRALVMATSTGLIVGIAAYRSSHSLTAAAIVAAILFVPILVLGGSALRHEALKAGRKAVAADPTTPALGIHTMEVTPESVTEVSSHHTLSVRWDAVAKAIRTPDYFFLFLRTSAVMIIPLRSFASSEEGETFFQYVQQFAPAA